MSEHDDHPRNAPPPRRTFHHFLDEIIARAHADGLMDHLPGQGQPLTLDEDALVPEEDRLGYRMLKSSGFAPPWIAARRDIDEERVRIDLWLRDANRRWAYLAEPARAPLRATYKRKLDDLQRMILTFNLKAPPGVAHVEGLRMAEELHKLGTGPADSMAR